MKRIKYSWMFIIACLLFAFSGCSTIDLSIGGEFKPPMLNKEQEGINTALTNSIPNPQNIKLKYPKSGIYRSSFVMFDIDGDGENEAICFYERKASTDAEGNKSGIRINIIDKIEEEWVSISDNSGVGTEIEKILFLQSKDNPKPFIIIGFSGASDGNSVYIIYQWEGSSLNKLSEHSCLAFETMDLDGDGENEIFNIVQNVEEASVNNEETATVKYAQVIKYIKGEFQFKSTVELDSEVDSYVNILNRRQSDDEIRIYIDGRKGTNLFNTQILGYTNNELKNYTKNTDILNKTERSSVSACKDINGDGKYDIPRSILIPGYRQNDKTVMYYTNWYTFGEENFEDQPVKSTYVNTADGYYFALPSEIWQKEVSAIYDAQEHEVLFFNYKGNLDDTAEELLRIRIVTKIDYENNPSLYSEYERLDDKEDGTQIYYLAKTFNNTSYDNAISNINSAKLNFSLIPN